MYKKLNSLEKKIGMLQGQIKTLDPNDRMTRNKFTGALIDYLKEYAELKGKAYTPKKSKYALSENDIKGAFIRGFQRAK